MIKIRRYSFGYPGKLDPVPIVADGAIGTGKIAEGKILPVLLLDTSERPDLKQLIDNHEHTGPGDVQTTWVYIGVRKELILLVLEFKKPSELTIILEFEIASQGILVDQIMRSGAVYLQDGKEGDKVSERVEAPSIVAEVGARTQGLDWDKNWHKQLAKSLRSKGLTRAQSNIAARKAIESMREFGKIRISHMRPDDNLPD